jgi:hypothetical protein
MNVSELITKLSKLQLEQDDIIRQLATIARDTETTTKDKDKKPKAQNYHLRSTLRRTPQQPSHV